VLPYSGNFGPIFRDVVKDHVLGLLEDVGGRGVCFCNITNYTRDLIYAGQFGADIRNSETVFRRRVKGNIATSPYYKKDIPWSVMYAGTTNSNPMNNRSQIFPI